MNNLFLIQLKNLNSIGLPKINQFISEYNIKTNLKNISTSSKIFLFNKKRLFPKTTINVQPFVIFLSGGPGVKKSWIINMFDIFI